MQNLRMIYTLQDRKVITWGMCSTRELKSGASSCWSSSQSGSKDNCEPPREHAVCKARYFSAMARCEQG